MLLEPLTRLRYCEWASRYRRRVGKKVDVQKIGDPYLRKLLLKAMREKITTVGGFSDVTGFRERDGWTTAVMKQFVYSYLDENRGFTRRCRISKLRRAGSEGNNLLSLINKALWAASSRHILPSTSWS